ncbi:alginate export family protein [Thermodesulfovibrio thiophilus]|uniref:alginate export family protein n=1 Tax=Thermodesulfovibrio thiophilus TaxID=340095 RepID=UPI00040CD34C|nr:alginate export family protein [Thermodesulfovibrio thiophilus]
MKKYAGILAVLVLLLGLAALSYAAPAEIPSDTTAVISKGKTQITLGGEIRIRGMYGRNLDVIDDNAYKTEYEYVSVPKTDENGKPITKPITIPLYLVDDEGNSFTVPITLLDENGKPLTETEYKKVKQGRKGKSRNQSYYEYRVRLNMEAKISPNTTGYVELESSNENERNTSENTKWGTGTQGPRGNYPFGNWHDESSVYIRQAWIQHQGTGLLGVPLGVKVGKQLIKLGNGLFFDHTYFGDDAILAFVQPLKELTIAAYTIKFDENNIYFNDDSTAYGLLASYAGHGWGISADATYVDHQNVSGLYLNNKNFYDTNAYYIKNDGTVGYNVNLYEADIHLWNFGLRGNYDDIAGTGLGIRADVEFQTGKVELPGSKDLDLKGWAVLGGLDYKFKSIPLIITAEYARGSGNEDEKDIDAFITALGPEQHYTFVYEYLAPSACNFGANFRTGLCNTQYVKLGAASDITKDLKAEVYGYWLKAVEDVSIHGGKKDDDLGWEVDGKVTYQLDKGLIYWVEGGYFWAGDAYDMEGGKSADDAWAVRHGIQLKF